MVSNSEILIYNLEEKKAPPAKFFRRIIEKSLWTLKEKKKAVLSLIFVSPSVMRRLNRSWRGKDRVTTVLSFPAGSDIPAEKGKKEKDLGDIFLCQAEIKKQAEARGLALEDFYRRLVVHSLLHLYGYDHQNKKEEKRMENRENKILASI